MEPSPPVALVVDDAEDMLVVIAAVVQRAGFRAVTAADGYEALALLRAGLQPAVAVTDVDMPTMNGVELFAAIRGELALRDTPVIFHSTSRQPVGLGDDSACRWLAKPAEASELQHALESVT
jgi:two-component system chemotaxis response regulator CheY